MAKDIDHERGIKIYREIKQAFPRANRLLFMRNGTVIPTTNKSLLEQLDKADLGKEQIDSVIIIDMYSISIELLITHDVDIPVHLLCENYRESLTTKDLRKMRNALTFAGMSR